MRKILVAGIAIACILMWGIVYVRHRDREARLQQEKQRRVRAILERERDVQTQRRRREQHRRAIIEILETPTTWEDALAVAELYRYGAYPEFAPHPHMAALLLRGIETKCEIPSIVQQACHMAQSPSIHERDVAGTPIPLEPGHRLLRRIQAVVKVPQPVEIRHHPVTPSRITPRPLVTGNQRQNSHDHGVTTSAQSTLKALQRDEKPAGNAVEALETLLFSNAVDMNDEEKAKALEVLGSLASDRTHSGLGVSEREALDLVWERIRRVEDETTRNNAAETLCKQLASGFEHGTTVCSTGKIARLVSSLDGLDLDGHRSLTPVWAVKEELGSLAARVRTDVLKTATDAQRRAYELGDAPDIEEAMRASFVTRASKTYRDDLGMSAKIVDPLIATYADGF